MPDDEAVKAEAAGGEPPAANAEKPGPEGVSETPAGEAPEGAASAPGAGATPPDQEGSPAAAEGVSASAETPKAPVGPVELDATAPEPEGGEDDGFMSAGDAKLAEANARYVRLAADFDNYRKRAVREGAELAAGAGEAMVRELLPVLDNLERALAACAAAKVEDGTPHAAAVESVAKGVELTLRQFQVVLAKQGVERLALAGGEPFDPHRHEALMQEERDDVPPGSVVGELEAGYTMRGRVIRPAKVRVSRAAG